MSPQIWIPIHGEVRVSDGVITHVPTPVLVTADAMPGADGASAPPKRALVRSNLEFEQGTINWESKLDEPSSRAQLMLPAEYTPSNTDLAKVDQGSAELSVGLNALDAPYGFAIWDGQWKPAGGAGHGTALPVDRWLHLKLTVRGSNADLFVEGVKVASTSCVLKRGQISALLQGPCTIRNVQLVRDLPICFAVMQFTDEFNILYRDVIRPICESYGYRVIRGDDFYTSGLIMDDVTESIRSAALIIADVTPDNANVFYEVGYAHAIAKPTILLSDKKRERLPFDISGFRTLFYENTIGGKALVEERLKQHLESLRAL